MKNFLTLVKVSRPRFWSYLAGTYLVGFTLGVSSLNDFDLEFWVFLIYFLFPANLFLYGINDVSDKDTDKYNDKKSSKEHRADKMSTRLIGYSLVVTLVLSLTLLLSTSMSVVTFLLITFILLSYFYSAPPVRFKARPVLDFLSNILYIIPGLIGYAQTGSELPGLEIIFGIATWAWAMHLFSAIPDIKPDKKAGLVTSAIFFGRKKSLIICFVLWSIFSSLVIYYQFLAPFSYLVLVYPILPLLILFNSKLDIDKIYWYYPYINAGLGALVFWVTVIPMI